ncbi:MAG TPA: hypothetical protein EYP62_05695 [Kiritimatiellae bacterium]|nr:hypothetical protein [Kiritimatiellia bacterium]
MKPSGPEIKEAAAGAVHLVRYLAGLLLARVLRAGAGILASFRVLGNPLAAARATVVLLFCTVTRVIFALADPVPGVIPYNPALALGAAAAFLWGMPAAWGSAAAMMLADSVCRQWGGVTFFRASAIFMLSATIAVLGGSGGGNRLRRSVFAALAAAWAGAFWEAAGIDVLGYYPFSRMAVLLLPYYCFFAVVLGIPLSRWYLSRQRRTAASAGQDQGKDSTYRPGVVPVAGVGSTPWKWAAIPLPVTVAVVLLEWLAYGFSPVVPAILGSAGGPLAWALLVAGMGLHALVLFNLPAELLRRAGSARRTS